MDFLSQLEVSKQDYTFWLLQWKTHEERARIYETSLARPEKSKKLARLRREAQTCKCAADARLRLIVNEVKRQLLLAEGVSDVYTGVEAGRA